MRKITTFKLLLALAIGAASVFGLFHVAAQPAEAALLCPHQIQGPEGSCTFSGYQHTGGYRCCMYSCTSGPLEGPCEICPY